MVRALLLSMVLCLALPALCLGADVPSPARYSLGEVEVWAIADNIGQMDKSLFGENEETAAGYMKDGKALSSYMAFLIRTPEARVLVDTGFGNDQSQLLAGLAAAGCKPEEITHVLLTHMHRDHIGGLARDGKPAFPKAALLASRLESEFWLGKEASAPEAPTRANADTAKEYIALYGDRFARFEFGESPLPGIVALDASGHTPGHTAYLLEAGDKRLLFIGDLLHASVVQFPRPDLCTKYDMDPAATVAARIRILNLAATEAMPVAGQHLPFPAVGDVRQNEQGFAYTPLAAF